MSANNYVVIDCGSLDDPDNGMISYIDTTFGSMVTYSCNIGYNLTGNSNRLCTVEGWSG